MNLITINITFRICAAACLIPGYVFLQSSVITAQEKKTETADSDELKTASPEPLGQLDVLKSVQAKIQQVREDFAAAETSDRNIRLQQEIIASLAKLLEQQKSSQDSSQSQDESTQQPAQKPEDSDMEGSKSKTDSDPSQGTDRLKPEDRRMTEEMREKIWGHLPERVRQRMRNMDGENFLPKYERLIRAYYERLASEPPRE